MHSGIYQGYLRHRRFVPHAHRFSYPVFMMYLDLDEIASVISMSPWWSEKRWRPARFVRSDFHGDASIPLPQALRRRIQQETGRWHDGPIRMLANLRYFGYNMNPIACYYCFDEDERLQTIVAEVTNTPWRERQSYVLECDPDKRVQRLQFDKRMHVSPFNPMNLKYHWCSSLPGRGISLNLETEREGHIEMDATLALKRQEIDRASLSRVLRAYPWMTARVFAGIHWQALKLWLKGNPIYDHPEPAPVDTGADSPITRLKT